MVSSILLKNFFFQCYHVQLHPQENLKEDGLGMEQKIHDINVQMVIVFQVEIIPIGTVIAHQPKLGTHQLWNNVFVSKIIKLLGLAITMGPKGQSILQCLFGTYFQFSKKIRFYCNGASSQLAFVHSLGELKTPKRHFEIN